MNAADTTCSECGTPRVNDTPGSECEKCGSTAITVHVFAAEAIAMSETVTWKMGPANTAPVRRDVLKASLADIQEAVQQNDARAAYIALKRALEAMHELEDCRNRQEWTPAGWTPDELNLWAAHMGARNAAHHTSSTVVGATSA
jgi:hypothetical protein